MPSNRKLTYSGQDFFPKEVSPGRNTAGYQNRSFPQAFNLYNTTLPSYPPQGTTQCLENDDTCGFSNLQGRAMSNSETLGDTIQQSATRSWCEGDDVQKHQEQPQRQATLNCSVSGLGPQAVHDQRDVQIVGACNAQNFQNSSQNSFFTIPTATNIKVRKDLPVEAEHAFPGNIVWLVEKHQQPQSREPIKCSRSTLHEGEVGYACSGQEIRDEVYNHAVVITAVKQRAGSSHEKDLICTVVPIDSWKNTKLRIYFGEKDRLIKFQSSIPIFHPNEDAKKYIDQGHPFLSTEGGMKLYCLSYANYQHTYDIPLAGLRAFSCTRYPRAYQLRLTEKSYETLTSLARIPNDPFLDTITMMKEAPMRLRWMAALNWDTDEEMTRTPREKVRQSVPQIWYHNGDEDFFQLSLYQITSTCGPDFINFD